MKPFPIARRDDLIVEKLPDEVLVYDLRTDKAHCLNRTAALIWEHCDGKKTESDIAALLQGELDSPVTSEVVVLGLAELESFGLLKVDAAAPQRQQLSRRRLIQNLGLSAALALPLIVSISAPAAAQAGSTADPCVANPGANGCPCTFDANCDSQNCNAGTCGPEL
jgi:hypothetical protein